MTDDSRCIFKCGKRRCEDWADDFGEEPAVQLESGDKFSYLSLFTVLVPGDYLLSLCVE